jgi:hypothetical protein
MVARHGLLLGSLLVLIAGCTDGSADAERLGEAFCAAAMARDEAVATAMMTPELQDQVARVRAFDARFRRQRPGDKPPLGDGLRLTAFPDAVASCGVTVESPLQVVVRYIPSGSPDGDWADRLLLVRGPGTALRVGDIAFAGDNRVRLRRWLDEAMVE